MRSVYIVSAMALLLLASPVLAADGERTVLYERLFADGFVANEQAYMVFEVPEGSTDVAFELSCNLHAGTLTLLPVDATGHMGSPYSVVCDGLLERAVLQGELPAAYYYGAASFSGLNGVRFRVSSA